MIKNRIKTEVIIPAIAILFCLILTIIGIKIIYIEMEIEKKGYGEIKQRIFIPEHVGKKAKYRDRIWYNPATGQPQIYTDIEYVDVIVPDEYKFILTVMVKDKEYIKEIIVNKNIYNKYVIGKRYNFK